MKRKIKSSLVLLTAFALGVLASCTSTDEGIAGNDSTKGSLKVLLTDAPFPSDQVAEVNVTIDKVSIKKVDDATTEETDESGFIILSEETQEFNLLDLQNGIVANLADTSAIEVGTYSEIRLHIVKAEVVLTEEEGSETFDLKIPSGTSSGLKIKIDGGVEIKGNLEAVVIVDFDVSRSFLVQGNPAKNGKELTGFKFKPVVRATAQDFSGEISGKVTFNYYDDANAPLDSISAGIPVYILSGEDTISSALTDDQGYYSVIGLVAGTYTVACSVDGYNDFSESYDVIEKETTTVNINMEETLGTIEGTVSTTEGEGETATTVLLGGVTVEIKNAADEIIASAVANEEGFYSVADLLPGTYKVTCSVATYDSFEQTNVIVAKGDVITVEISLSLTSI
ncbi:DUF4382 domain-containing protein [Mangrovibacterium lignilyticum]|uniref:DUF4382 domain-containing protein n=1 Tax=Mangrovibacterium lignilyticum TaxID=2668052 RepID=UPI0013D053D1|nr:DUF4382 domain-containing protein [Mangrovibacterium lignilyticum]